MTNDDISGIFDNVNPQDFHRITSARDVIAIDRPSFETFVENGLNSLRYGFYAADGMPNPVAVMLAGKGQMFFAPDDDESLGQYVERLHREAERHKAYAVFTAWLTEGMAYEGDVQGTIGDPDAYQEAADAGNEPQTVLYWFSQMDDEIRHGIMLVAHGDTGRVVETDPEHASPVYRQILGG